MSYKILTHKVSANDPGFNIIWGQLVSDGLNSWVKLFKQCSVLPGFGDNDQRLMDQKIIIIFMKTGLCIDHKVMKTSLLTLSMSGQAWDKIIGTTGINEKFQAKCIRFICGKSRIYLVARDHSEKLRASFPVFCQRAKQEAIFFRIGFPCGSAGKESACNVGDLGSIPRLGRSPGEGKGYPLQYSGLENPWTVQFIGSQRVRHD